MDVDHPAATPVPAPKASGPRVPDGSHAAPVATAPVRRRPSAGRRWPIAILLSLLIVVLSAAGAFALTAGAATSSLVGYVPAGSYGYAEVRLDAPGDQHQNAANLLAHFPGFADQSILGTKIGQALDQVLGRVSAGSQTFTGDIQPWLGDAAAVVLTRPPTASDHAGGGALLVATTNPTAAGAWATSTFGPASSTDTYGGVGLSVVEHAGHAVEFGVVGTVLVAGDAASVHAVIDTHGASTFAQTPVFTAAVGSVSGDHLAFGYLDMQQVVANLPTPSGGGPAMRPPAGSVPAWVAFAVRAESGALTTTLAFPRTTLSPTSTNRPSALASVLPADTVAMADIHNLGGMVTTALGVARSSAPSPEASRFAQGLQALGGADSLVGWMGDATVVALDDGTAPEFGAVVQAADATTAGNRLTELKNLVTLAGSSAGVNSREETYAGTTITILDGGDASALLGPRASAVLPAGAHLEIALAQKGNLLIAGIGDAFTKAVLDTTPGTALADQARYQAAVSAAGASNAGEVYADVPALLALLETRMDSAQRSRFEADILPYLKPIQAVAGAGSAGDPMHIRFVVTVGP